MNMFTRKILFLAFTLLCGVAYGMEIDGKGDHKRKEHPVDPTDVPSAVLDEPATKKVKPDSSSQVASSVQPVSIAQVEVPSSKELAYEALKNILQRCGNQFNDLHNHSQLILELFDSGVFAESLRFLFELGITKNEIDADESFWNTLAGISSEACFNGRASKKFAQLNALVVFIKDTCGVDLNKKDGKGYSPLSRAFEQHNFLLAYVLMLHCADASAVPCFGVDNGENALHCLLA